LLRIWLGVTPGYPPDLNTYKLWSIVAGTRGIQTIYDPMPGSGGEAEGVRATSGFGDYDYPPLYAYLLAPIGALYGSVVPEPLASFADSKGLNLLVKIPPFIFDLLVAGLIVWVARRLRGDRVDDASDESRPDPKAWKGIFSWAALAYLLQPAVLFNSGYWGQPDSIHGFFVILALTLVLLRRFEPGWIALALGCMMKPLAAPYIPLIALATILRGGWRRLATSAAAAAGTGLVLMFPFILTGRATGVIRHVLFDVDLMPFNSVNAHNLWWLIGPWRSARDPWIGPLNMTHVGLLLFGISYAAVLAGLWKGERRRGAVPGGGGREGIGRSGGARSIAGPLAGEERWFIAAACVAFAFFFFSTHMHENHLFMLIPLSALLAIHDRSWRPIMLAAGIVVLVNMALHDMILGERLFANGRPSSLVYPGTTIHMPQTIRAIGTVNSVLTAMLFVGFARRAMRALIPGKGA
jgi:hypothetical protein